MSSSIGRWLTLVDDEPEDFEPYTLPELDDWGQACQRRYADQFNAVQVIAKTAGHAVLVQQPDLVALAVRSVVEAARTGQRPVLDRDQVDRLGGVLVRI